jgi:hypothetical protein
MSDQLCACGCGEFTLIGEKTGQPNRYVFNHHYRQSPVPLADRFWARVEKTDGCWEWQGKLNQGYGVVWDSGRVRQAHRFAWELLRGAIPDGLTLDHLCRNRRCVNPGHLEPVTAVENTMRGQAPHAINARKTHCVRGHAFDDENTYVRSDGARICRACVRARNAQVRKAVAA